MHGKKSLKVYTKGVRPTKIYVCLGFLYLPYCFALKNAYPNIFMVILA
jgi:hypothetical protein